jgi:hypothetical protein
VGFNRQDRTHVLDQDPDHGGDAEHLESAPGHDELVAKFDLLRVENDARDLVDCWSGKSALHCCSGVLRRLGEFWRNDPVLTQNGQKGLDDGGETASADGED